MKANLSVLKYWRAAVADSASRDACLTTKASKEFQTVSSEEARTGRLSQETIHALFKDKPDTLKQVEVLYRPLHVRRMLDRGAVKNDGLPAEVAPILTDAAVDRKGRIIPGHTRIARDILDPLLGGGFSIGNMRDCDRFLTMKPSEANPADPTMWSSYQAYWKKMMEEVGAGWPHGDKEYTTVDSGLICLATNTSQTVRQILALSDTLIKEQPDAPLLANFARTKIREIEPTIGLPFILHDRLGHSNHTFPVADQQREVLAHLAKAGTGEILAVNGPPGTGKTTMLLSAIAGEWIKAALAGGNPPLIIAASTNNQAVTNIIDAFAKDFAKGDGVFAGRWLPEFFSFGLFLASLSKENEATQKYQTDTFFRQRETAPFLAKARIAYLDAAKLAFPHLKQPTVETVVKQLRANIEHYSRKLLDADETWRNLVNARARVRQTLGVDPDNAIRRLLATKVESETIAAAASELLKLWDIWLAKEPWLTSALSFLPFVAQKRVIRARIFLRELGVDGTLLNETRLERIEANLKAFVTNKQNTARQAAETYHQSQRELKNLRDHISTFQAIYSGIGGKKADPDILDFDRQADVTIRFSMFLLATHYWEGRWLLELEKILPALEKVRKDKRGESDRDMVEALWRMRMMITPCAVSTFATLPGKMTCRDKVGRSYQTEYLYNYIDLLIVDEAGQVLPEIAGPSFSLAKRALVIGDTQQIEPITSLTATVDAGNLAEAGLIPHGRAEEALEDLEAVGITSRTGSVMRLAQSSCRFHPYENLERGLYLFEHRRCYDDIIRFCNELCYQGTLQPKRGPSADMDIPPMGYLHIDGIAQAAGGSRYNLLEARMIAAWIKANAGDLEKRYRKPLSEIIGVVTPFGRQVSAIRTACREFGIDASKETGITVGTVHALQGAERQIVIFSPVYTKHADGGFIDQSPSMLNVAVSRAKDAFLVFGDMDVFAAAAPATPRSLLARFLFEHPENEIVFEQQARVDLSKGSLAVEMLRDSAEHDAFMLRALSEAKQRVAIVSPWIKIGTMEQVGLISAIRAAQARGVQMSVYADPVLTRGKASNADLFEEADNLLSSFGVAVRPVEQLHSKLLWVDDALLAVGSFNWCSAHRAGDYARHETSIVYRGPHLASEIATLESSLKNRAALLRQMQPRHVSEYNQDHISSRFAADATREATQ
ncbi:hypothetical protein G6M84_11875 [Agrobacterium tumefaciens]|uniref:AAA domain-containing protein n=1 Tax=Agrobacterium tumefaciens TaxID=358 RepID=UPI001573A8A7|nr:AAA domain-containing protein [Agrobacterium tumefaciens]NTB97206.1 hypothetical protein [Agrobacterium tumefaciens]NTC46865.1 hypothetical protein [Agrobacterium tumefaciens]